MDPAAFVPPDAAVLADLNFAEMCRMITRNVGGRVLDLDGLLLWSGAHPSPALVNGVIRTGAGGRPPASDVLDVAGRWFAEVEHGYTAYVRLGRDDDLESAALARGFVQIVELPVMVYDGAAPRVTVPDGYTVRRVRDEVGMRDLVAAVGGPFELPDEVASAFSRLDAVLAPFVGAMVARDATGRPVAGAWTGVSHGVAGIGFVGTLDDARGRGLGTAVTAAAIRLGYEMGARCSALQSSPMGRPVYARLGFREVGTYRVLVDPASPPLLRPGGETL